MKRRDFFNLLGGITLASVLPVSAIGRPLQDYTVEQLIGKGSPDFKGDGFLMHPLAYEAFLKMKKEALLENIRIDMVSAYRSFQRQKEIFEGKYTRFTAQGEDPQRAIQRIIEYSTIPGTSRHHWGTDIDIIDGTPPAPESVLQAKHFHGDGPFCKMKEWLNKNAGRFGFIEVYTDDPKRKGFKYEPWHFSYAPVSVPMLREYKKLDVKQILQQEKIKGSEYFSQAFIESYRSENILDINPKLL